MKQHGVTRSASRSGPVQRDEEIIEDHVDVQGCTEQRDSHHEQLHQAQLQLHTWAGSALETQIVFPHANSPSKTGLKDPSG